jgi:hypothetical protein
MALTKVSGHVIDQPFDVGIITATNFRSGVATVGTMHVTGNLQVDGTTTTLDTIVTEVDRLEVAANNNTVGLAVTQSGTGDIFNLYDGATEVFSVADGGDVTITDSIIHSGDTNTKLRFPAADTITAETGGTERLRITSDGHIGIGLTNPEWNIDIKDTSANAVIRLKSSGSTNGGQLQVNSDDLILRNRDAGELQLWTNDANKLTITSDGKVRVPDSGKFTAGAGDDLQIYHSGVNSFIRDSGTGSLFIEGTDLTLRAADSTTRYLVANESNGDVSLFFGNNKKFETTTTGISVTGQVNASTMHLTDGNGIHIGTGNDLRIYHDGSNSYIDDAGTGNLIIGAANFQLMNVAHSENHITATDNAQIELFYDGSKKLETTTTGAKITGALEVTQEYPTIRPTLDLNFAATKTLDRRITFTRDSLGTFIGEDGLLKYAPNNMPRFDHDPNTGESLGLLIEESGTNTKTNSQVFTSGWNRSGIEAVTQNTSIVTPSGSTDSTGVGVLTESSGGTVHQFYAASSSQVTKYITYSIFAKPNGRSHIQLVTSGFVHNLADGTTSGSASGEFISAKTEKLSNGWCRCSVVRNHSNSYDQFNVKLSNGSSTSYSGDGSSGVYIWGVQQEDKAFLTSYIPTNGSAVTRAADFATIKGTNFTDFYNQNEGTLFSEFTIKDDTYSSAAIANINQEPGASYAYSIMFVEVGTANGYFGRTYLNSSGINISNSSSILNSLHPSTTPQTVSFGYTTATGGTLAAYWNGNFVSNSSDLSKVPTTLTNMRIGRGWNGGSDVINAHIRKLSYYNKRLPNAQLQGLTQQ